MKKTDDIIKRLLNYFLSNYQNEEVILRNASGFVFESVDLLFYHATKNPKNEDNKCFQYSITVALNHESIENHPEKISNSKRFINQYNWEDIDFPAGIKDQKKFERNNKTIALNIWFISYNTKKINLPYKSKYNCKREDQIVLLMITSIEQSNEADKWHYIVFKSVRTDDGFNRPVRSWSRLF